MRLTSNPRLHRAAIVVGILFMLGLVLLAVYWGVAAERAREQKPGKPNVEAPAPIEAVDGSTVKPGVDLTQSFRDIHDDGLDCSTCHVPKHVALTPCTDCHEDTTSGWVLQHPYFSNCQGCHSRPAGHFPGACSTCHKSTDSFYSAVYTHEPGGDCSICHAPPHEDKAGACSGCHGDPGGSWLFAHPASTVCRDCHTSPAKHYPADCYACHQSNKSFGLVAYEHRQASDCGACHVADHAGKGDGCFSCHPRLGDSWVFVHTTTTTCDDCHDSPRNHYGTGCSNCHGSPVARSTTWRLGCNQSGCHTLSTSAKHIPPTDNELCTDCHDQGSLADIHLGAEFTGDAATYRSCLVCHSPQAPPISDDCQDCHDDMFTPDGGWVEHGYISEDHQSAPASRVVDINGTAYGPLDCVGCHELELRNEHFKVSSSSSDAGCASCHPNPKATLLVWEKGCVQAGCHVEGSATQLHGEIDADHDVALDDVLTCEPAGCHTGDKALLHGSMENGCGACHSAGVPAVLGCGVCHDDKYNDDGSANIVHAFDEVTHMADPPNEDISVSGVNLGNYQCSICHEYRIGEEHEKATSSSAGVGCQTCHPSPRSTFADWDKSCAQGGCHELATGVEKHLLIDSAHEVSIDMQATCQQDCHTGSSAEIHRYASTTIDEVVVMGCLVCHASGIPAPADCVECHETPHLGADHSGTRESCGLAGCHDQGPADELHVNCQQCHSLATLPTSTMCVECHTVTEPHDAFAANHVGDVSGSIRSNSIPGCGGVPNPGRANYVGLCHDVSNTMKIHENVHSKSDGCPECHASGMTLSNRCVDCHIRRTGDPVKADVPSGNAVHHDNNKYLKDPADIVEGSYSRSGAPGGYQGTLVNYDCQFCHWGFFYGSKPALPERRSPYAGSSMWYAGLRTGAGGLPTDTTLQIPGTFAASADMTLEYMVNYQGRVTDYGYTEVSVDGGVTWVTVPGNITSTAPVSATHLGNGISGNSVTWTKATFSLAAYDGQTISLRLRYKTPYQSVAPGFGYAVDDIELLEGGTLLFSDGAEDAGAGLITANWLRTGIYPPGYLPDDPDNAP